MIGRSASTPVHLRLELLGDCAVVVVARRGLPRGPQDFAAVRDDAGENRPRQLERRFSPCSSARAAIAARRWRQKNLRAHAVMFPPGVERIVIRGCETSGATRPKKAVTSRPGARSLDREFAWGSKHTRTRTHPPRPRDPPHPAKASIWRSISVKRQAVQRSRPESSRSVGVAKRELTGTKFGGGAGHRGLCW